MGFLTHYLKEMLVVGDTHNTHVIAFDKWIFLLNPDLKEENLPVLKNITKKLKLPLSVIPSSYDLRSFDSNIGERLGDVLIGDITDKKILYITSESGMPLDPKSSELVRKVVMQLGLKSASYQEDIDSTETTVQKKKMIRSISDIAYHGTTSKYLNSILSTGLRYGESDSNYSKQGIYHEDLIFFTTRIGEAMHHSITTARQQKWGNIPIILEFQIPDKDLVIADYDVEKMTDNDIHYGNTGQRNKYQARSYKQDPDKLSKEFGIYGYKGNIKPIFIKYVYVGLKPVGETYNIEKDFKRMKPKAALKYIEMYGDM